MVTNMHGMYNLLCKRLIQISEEFERKMMTSNKVKSEHSEVILEFVKSIAFLHISISHQLNSNTVTLGTKTHRIAKNRLEILKDRMLSCYSINKVYVKAVDQFNEQEKDYTKECEYFKDY